MSKKIFLLSLLIGLIGGGLLLFSIGKSDWLLSWTIGVLLGIYPFIFWQITQTILNKLPKYSQNTQDKQHSGLPFRYYLILTIAVLKFVIIGLIIILIGSWGDIIGTALLTGFLIMPLIILAIVLIRIYRSWLKHKDLEKINI